MSLQRFALRLCGLIAFSASAQAQVADLLAIKSGPKFAAADSDVTYVLGIDHLGVDDASNITMTDFIPAGMSFVSLTQDSGVPTICVTPGVGSGGMISCTLAALTSGASTRLTLVLHIDPATPAGTAITNSLGVSCPEDPNNKNDVATTTLFVPGGAVADVGVGKLGPAHIGAGSDITYTLSVQNSGPDSASNMVLTDVLPAELSFVSLTQTAGAPIGCITPAVGAGGSIVCTATDLANGAAASWELVAHVGPTLPSGTTIVNQATVSSNNDGSEENNVATQTAQVSAVDLGVTAALPAQALAGAALTANVTWRNDGPDIARQPVLNLAIPVDTSFVSIVQDSGPAASCNAFGGNVQCTMGNFPSATSSSFSLNLMVAATAVHASTLTLDVQAASQDADPDPIDNQASANSTVLGAADIGIGKTAAATADAGSALVYTIDLANTGFQDATTVQWQDVLPAGTSFASLLQTNGPTFTCTTPAPGATGLVDCSLASLPTAGSASFQLTVLVPTTVAEATLINNSASATTSSVEANTANNMASTATRVSGVADLEISKTGPADVVIGSDISYTIEIANSGFQPAANVLWQDALPAGTSFVSLTQLSGPIFNCTTPAVGANGNVGCSITTLASATSAEFQLRVSTVNASVGDIRNSVQARSSSVELDANNNSAAATVAAIAAPLPPPSVPIPVLADRAWQLLLAALLLLMLATARRGR